MTNTGDEDYIEQCSKAINRLQTEVRHNNYINDGLKLKDVSISLGDI